MENLTLISGRARILLTLHTRGPILSVPQLILLTGGVRGTTHTECARMLKAGLIDRVPSLDRRTHYRLTRHGSALADTALIELHAILAAIGIGASQ